MIRKAILFVLLILALGAVTPVKGQTTHSATVSWSDALNPVGSTTYSVYRAPGLCSGTPVFAKIATGLTALTFKDSTVTPGNFCFTVTATVGGVESAQAVPVLATVPAFSPTGVTVTVQ